MIVDDWEPPDSDADAEVADATELEEPRVGGLLQPPIVGGLPQPPIGGGLPQRPVVEYEPGEVQGGGVGEGRGVGQGRGRGMGRGRGVGKGRARGLRPLLGSRLKTLKRGDASTLEEIRIGGLPPVPKRRQLKRRISDTRPDAACAATMICVWGGEVKTPVVVQPIWKELGTTWMSPNEHCGWLRRACSSKGLTHYKELFQSAVSALRRELQAGMAAVNPDPAGELRASLNLDSDESDGDKRGGSTAACPKAACPKSKKKAASKRTPTGAKTLDVILADATIKVQNKLRPFRVEVTEESVIAIMKWCRQHVLNGKATLKKHQTKAACPKAAAPSWSMPVDECPTILGKVTWQPSHVAWCVHGKDDNGKIVKTRVKVGGKKEQQGFFTSARENYFVDRKNAYIAAIELWNEKDKSTRDRIEAPTIASLSMEGGLPQSSSL